MDVAIATTSRTDGLRRLAAALTAGALAGFAIGGLGGRVAMLILRLTSDPSLRGLPTDDDFTIGVISSATLFLLGFTTILGALGGAVYLAIRSWLPEHARPWIVGGLAGLLVAPGIIRPGGIDFTRLEPLVLAVAMFVAIPVAYGVAVTRLADRWIAAALRPGASRAWLAGLVFLLAFVFAGPTGLVGVVLALAIALVGSSDPTFGAWWSSPAITWIGRALLVAIAIRSAVDLVGDAAEVL